MSSRVMPSGSLTRSFYHGLRNFFGSQASIRMNAPIEPRGNGPGGSAVGEEDTMAHEKEDETLRIVPLGAVGPETVAEVAHGLRRLTRTRVEIVAPRRVVDARPEALLARHRRAHLRALGRDDVLRHRRARSRCAVLQRGP